MSLIGDGIGHVAFAGVAAGYLLGISPVLTALCFAVDRRAFAIEWLRARAAGPPATRRSRSSSTPASRCGVVLISRAGRARTSNLFQFLFGSILTVTRGDLLWPCWRSAGLARRIAVLYRGARRRRRSTRRARASPALPSRC